MGTYGGVMALTVVLACGGGAMLAAPAQVRPEYPGQPTRARVWIENRGAREAVPVALEVVSTDAPIAVQTIGVASVAPARSAVFVVQATRQTWEYRTVTVPAGDDTAGALEQAGLDGWEATGVTTPAAGGTALLLKRPR
jgi:hypothetical protein